MNQPSIDLYAEAGVDLRKGPIEIGVCSQHCNGGFAVDAWWESSLPRLFILGEQAGTHGVTRPGGAALNSGQVGGLRAAQRIASTDVNSRPTRISASGKLGVTSAARGNSSRLRTSIADGFSRRERLVDTMTGSTISGGRLPRSKNPAAARMIAVE